jgi:hypothetical protein
MQLEVLIEERALAPEEHLVVPDLLSSTSSMKSSR